MIHIGPHKLYATLQRDINWAAKHNYQIFFEGVKKNPSREVLTRNEGKIKEFFLFLFDLYPFFGAAFGVSFQRDKIAYPKDAINADITFADLTRRLDENGFKCSLLLLPLEFLGREELKRKIHEGFKKKGGWNAFINNSEKWTLGRFLARFLFRKATPVLLDYRNEVAVAKIQECSDGRNIFIHYGEKHVKGLVDLLRRDGWIVKEMSDTDLAEYC